MSTYQTQERICLCKQPRCSSHFLGHVSPIFCTYHFTLFLLPHLRQYLIPWLFSFFDRSGCVYTPKVDAYPFFNVLNHRSLLLHITLKFQTKLDVIFKLSFLSKHCLPLFILAWCLIWQFNKGPIYMPPRQIRIKKLSSRGMFADWVLILKISVRWR